MMRVLKPLLFALLFALSGPAAAHLGDDRSVELKPRMCHAVADDPALSAAAVRQLSFSCTGRPEDFHQRWLWLRADKADIPHFDSDWRLVVDQTRFAEMRAVVVYADEGIVEHRFRSGAAEGHWAVGGFLQFEVDARPSPVSEIYLGVDRLVNFNTMRKVRAVAEPEFISTQILWVAIASVFAGVVGASLVYTSFLYAGLRHAFLRQYAFWCLAVLAYGLSWSNLAFYAVPELAGSWGVRLNLWAAGLATLFAPLFMVAFLEPRALPRRLRTLLVGTGWLSLAAAVLASFDQFGAGYAYVADRALNSLVAFGVVLMLICIGVAYRRGSRSVSFYALAWSPALAAFVVRVLRNFHVVPHSDWIDIGLFGATILETMLLSVAISDRFRKVETERNTAQSERAALSHLAETDDLTGLFNRRGFVARVEVIAASRPAAMGLVLIDVDHFKSVNDRFGHDAGDRALAEVGRVLGRLGGRKLAVGRLGGEEFGIAAALPCEDLVALGESVRREIAALRFDFGGETAITISAGVAFVHHAVPFVDLYRRADAALYEAKRKGRDCVVTSEDEPTRRVA